VTGSKVVVDPVIAGDEEEVELASWLQPDGATVEAGQLIAELNVAKATVEIAAPVSGRLQHHVTAGAIVAPGQAIASIDD
jgi:pyruvate/2-oxoglutarate dehydrogenase complex dihydrolipoamide acyltransferase (E2) component